MDRRKILNADNNNNKNMNICQKEMSEILRSNPTRTTPSNGSFVVRCLRYPIRTTRKIWKKCTPPFCQQNFHAVSLGPLNFQLVRRCSEQEAVKLWIAPWSDTGLWPMYATSEDQELETGSDAVIQYHLALAGLVLLPVLCR